MKGKINIKYIYLEQQNYKIVAKFLRQMSNSNRRKFGLLRVVEMANIIDSPSSVKLLLVCFMTKIKS